MVRNYTKIEIIIIIIFLSQYLEKYVKSNASKHFQPLIKKKQNMFCIRV